LAADPTYAVQTMTELLTQPKKEARKKGMTAAAIWLGTGVAAAAGLGYVAAGAGAAAAWYTFKWLKFRGKWGLRF
jgi:hypothetical protein